LGGQAVEADQSAEADLVVRTGEVVNVSERKLADAEGLLDARIVGWKELVLLRVFRAGEEGVIAHPQRRLEQVGVRRVAVAAAARGVASPGERRLRPVGLVDRRGGRAVHIALG